MKSKTKTINPVLGFAGAEKAVGKTVAVAHLESRYGYERFIPRESFGLSRTNVIEPVDNALILGCLRAADGLLVWVGPRDDSKICITADHYLDSIQDVGYEEFLRRVDHLMETLQQC